MDRYLELGESYKRHEQEYAQFKIEGGAGKSNLQSTTASELLS